jgi:drug/metabolite transporter (DMT)-like permease
VVSSFCTVTASVICKKMLKGTDSIVITGYSQLFGGVILLAIGFACGGEMRLAQLGDYLLFGYMVVATCASYMIWYTIVQKYELSKLFITKLSEPVFAAIIGAIILKEDLLQWHYIGAFLCIATAVIVSNVPFPKWETPIAESKQDEQ